MTNSGISALSKLVLQSMFIVQNIKMQIEHFKAFLLYSLWFVHAFFMYEICMKNTFKAANDSVGYRDVLQQHNIM